jgi:hypothetical protein
LKNNIELFGQTNKETIEKELPEYLSSVSTFGFQKDPIIKKTMPSTKRILVRRGPMPNDYKLSGGKMVCSKKNDKPSKSKKNKKGHMDMECCLDPDEIPNPNCYYPQEKYGNLLAKTSK